MTINSSKLNGNSAPTGGGIFNDGKQQGDTQLQISNSTFGGNSASVAAGGIYLVGQGTQNVTVSLANTIFADWHRGR